MAGWFKPLRGKVKSIPILGFDIEGIGGPDGFLCGAIVGDSIYQFFTDSREMLRALLDYGADGYRIYSHNLQYDLPILEGGQYPGGDLLFTRSGLLWADYKHRNKKVRLYDSANLFPRMSIAGIGAELGYPKRTIADSLMRRIVAKTPWSSFIPRDQEEIRKYCERDAEIVFIAVTMLQDLLNLLGGNLGSTLSGCAMDLYRRKYHKWPWMVVPPPINDAARVGYYGGRVENFAMGFVEGVNMYDVTSLYPYMMSVIKFPHPNHTSIDLEPRINGNWQSWEGVVSCWVKVPEMFIPALPRRVVKRVFYPVGEFSGVWPITEIRSALDYGVQLLKVDWVLGSEVTFNPFKEYIKQLYKMREGYLDSGSPLSNMVKLLMNSLYGRFGINTDGGLSRLVYLESGADLEKYPGYSTHEINGKIFAYGSASFDRPPDYANAFFAAQVTGSARAWMLRHMIAQGEDMIYTDTDSIITRGEVLIGDGLGKFRLQMENGSADMIGPKEYGLHNILFGDRYIAKGIPDRLAQEYIQTGAARFQRAVGIRESLNALEKPSTWVEVFRTHRQVIPKRYRGEEKRTDSGAWYVTYPYDSEELPGLVLGVRDWTEVDLEARERYLPFLGQAIQGKLV